MYQSLMDCSTMACVGSRPWNPQAAEFISFQLDPSAVEFVPRVDEPQHFMPFSGIGFSLDSVGLDPIIGSWDPTHVQIYCESLRFTLSEVDVVGTALLTSQACSSLVVCTIF